MEATKNTITYFEQKLFLRHGFNIADVVSKDESIALPACVALFMQAFAKINLNKLRNHVENKIPSLEKYNLSDEMLSLAIEHVVDYRRIKALILYKNQSILARQYNLKTGEFIGHSDNTFASEVLSIISKYEFHAKNTPHSDFLEDVKISELHVELLLAIAQELSVIENEQDKIEFYAVFYNFFINPKHNDEYAQVDLNAQDDLPEYARQEHMFKLLEAICLKISRGNTFLDIHDKARKMILVDEWLINNPDIDPCVVLGQITNLNLKLLLKNREDSPEIYSIECDYKDSGYSDIKIKTKYNFVNSDRDSVEEVVETKLQNSATNEAAEKEVKAGYFLDRKNIQAEFNQFLKKQNIIIQKKEQESILAHLNFEREKGHDFSYLKNFGISDEAIINLTDLLINPDKSLNLDNKEIIFNLSLLYKESLNKSKEMFGEKSFMKDLKGFLKFVAQLDPEFQNYCSITIGSREYDADEIIELLEKQKNLSVGNLSQEPVLIHDSLELQGIKDPPNQAFQMQLDQLAKSSKRILYQ